MRSGLDNPRVYGTVRTLLIGYGVAAFSLFFDHTSDPEGEALHERLLVIGVGVQFLLLAVRWLIRRRMDADLAPQALQSVELLGDGVTVLLFALATLGGVARFASGV
jgi:hypothetical protein